MKKILFIFLISLVTSQAIKLLSTEDWTIESDIPSGQIIYHYYLPKKSIPYGGISIYLVSIFQSEAHVYLEDYDSDSGEIPNDYVPSIAGKTEFPLRKIKNSNYFMILFERKSKFKIITIVIDNSKDDLTRSFKIFGIEPMMGSPILSKGSSVLIKLNQNTPKVMQLTALHPEDNGFTIIGFVSSNNKLLKIIPESKLTDSQEVFLKKAEVISIPKYATMQHQFIYYAIFFGEIEESFYFSYTYTEFQTLYFADKEERTNDRSYDVKVDNAYQPFFALGEYSMESDSLIYLEEVFGNITSYYSNSLYGKNVNNFLPDQNNGIKLNSNFIRAYSDVDIISVNCDSMCMFNLHIISLNTMASNKLSLGKNTYVLLNKFIEKEKTLELDFSIDNEKYYEISSINNKEATFYFMDESKNMIPNIRKFNYLNGTYFEKIPFNAKYIKLETQIGEDVLIVIKAMRESAYKVIPEEGKQTINTNNILIPFKQNREYYKIKIDLETSGYNFLYNVNYGDVKYVCESDVILPTANRTNNNHHFEILNPYLTKIGDISEDQKFYYSFTFNDTSSAINLNVEYIPKATGEMLNKDKTYHLDKYTKTSIQQNDDINKALLVIISKCDNKKFVDTYLSYNYIDLIRIYVNKNLFIQTFDDRQYSFDIKFDSSSSKYNLTPINFYYNYINKDSNDYLMYSNIMKEDFIVEYQHRLVNKKFTHISLTNPFAEQKKNQNYTFEIYQISNESLVNSCDKSKGKFIKNITSNLSEIDTDIEINRKQDSYLLVVLSNEYTNLPEIYYSPIKINRTRSGGSILFYVVIILAVLLVICIIGWTVYVCKYRATKNYEKSVKEINGLQNDNYGTSLVSTRSKDDEKEEQYIS